MFQDACGEDTFSSGSWALSRASTIIETSKNETENKAVCCVCPEIEILSVNHYRKNTTTCVSTFVLIDFSLVFGSYSILT